MELQLAKQLEVQLQKQPINKIIAVGTKEEVAPQPTPTPTPKPEDKQEEKIDKSALEKQLTDAGSKKDTDHSNDSWNELEKVKKSCRRC